VFCFRLPPQTSRPSPRLYALKCACALRLLQPARLPTLQRCVGCCSAGSRSWLWQQARPLVRRPGEWHHTMLWQVHQLQPVKCSYGHLSSIPHSAVIWPSFLPVVHGHQGGPPPTFGGARRPTAARSRWAAWQLAIKADGQCCGLALSCRPTLTLPATHNVNCKTTLAYAGPSLNLTGTCPRCCRPPGSAPVGAPLGRGNASQICPYPAMY